MSETAEERSKRQYLAHHRSKQWTYKHAIYYAQPTESSSLLDDMVKFKQLLRRKCPDQPFLIRIQLRNQPTLQAFLILYTTGKVDNLTNDDPAVGLSSQSYILALRFKAQPTLALSICGYSVVSDNVHAGRVLWSGHGAMLTHFCRSSTIC